MDFFRSARTLAGSGKNTGKRTVIFINSMQPYFKAKEHRAPQPGADVRSLKIFWMNLSGIIRVVPMQIEKDGNYRKNRSVTTGMAYSGFHSLRGTGGMPDTMRKK